MKHQPLFINVPFRMIEERIERISEFKIGAEIYAEGNLLDELSRAEITRVGSLLKDRGIACTVHAPFMDLSPGGIDNKIRLLSKDRVLKAVEMAHLLGAIGVVCHPGYDKWRFSDHQDLWLKSSIETWSEVIKEAKGGPMVMLENIFEETPDTLLALFGHFKADDLFFCFDTGHFNLFSTIALEAWLLPLKDRLREIHIHDNHGGSDEHLPVGKGTFPFRELKAFLRGKEGIIFTSEVPQEAYAVESLRNLKQFLSD